MHIWPRGRVSERIFSTRRISGDKTTFFGLIIMVMKIPEKMVIIFATAKNYSLTKPRITLLMSISTVSHTSEMIFVILKKAAALIENETMQ